MEKVLEFYAYFMANYSSWVVALNALCVALIGVFLMVPGPQPEAFLSKVVKVLARFSKK